MIIFPDLLYLNIPNGVVCYHINVFILGSRRYLERGNTFLGVSGEARSTKRGWIFFTNLSLMIFPTDNLKVSHSYTKIYFYVVSKNIPSHTSESSAPWYRCKYDSFLHWSHYNWGVYL